MGQTVSDSFQRIAANLGANWTNFINGFAANNNAKGTTAALINYAEYTGIPFTNDQVVTCTLATLNGTTDNQGAAVRINGTLNASANSYEVTESSTTLAIFKSTGVTPSSIGTNTSLASTAVTGAPGDVLKITVIGNSITVDRNGVTDVLQVADSTYASGVPGLFQFGNTATFSSFSATTMAAPAGTQLNVVCVGDSITSGVGVTTPWTNSLSLNVSPNSVTNLGIPSQGLNVSLAALNAGNINSMISMASASVDALFVPGITNVIILWGGSNDMANGGRTPAQVYADVQTYVAARRAAGWKVVVVENLSRSSNDAQQQTYNALLTGGSVFYDALVTLPATLTGVGAYSNTTYFQNGGIHPTQLSDTTIIAPAVSAAINSLPSTLVPWFVLDSSSFDFDVPKRHRK